MIDRPRRTLYVGTFAEKYPNPFVLVGHFNPHEQIDEEGTGQPSYLGVLTGAERGLDLVGEYTGIVNTPTATLRLSFAHAEDALRVAELVGARARADGAFEFTYDRPLYDKLRAANAARAAKQDPNLHLSFNDQFYLRALIESLAITGRTPVHGEPSSDDVNAFMVKRVIRAWHDPKFESWCGGFVLELIDGRRLYLESDESEIGPPWNVSMIELPTGQGMPQLSSRHIVNRVGWRTDLSKLDEYFQHLGSRVPQRPRIQKMPPIPK